MTGLKLGCWLAMWLYGGFSMQKESIYQSEKRTSFIEKLELRWLDIDKVLWYMFEF